MQVNSKYGDYQLKLSRVVHASSPMCFEGYKAVHTLAVLLYKATHVYRSFYLRAAIIYATALQLELIRHFILYKTDMRRTQRIIILISGIDFFLIELGAVLLKRQAKVTTRQILWRRKYLNDTLTSKEKLTHCVCDLKQNRKASLTPGAKENTTVIKSK